MLQCSPVWCSVQDDLSAHGTRIQTVPSTVFAEYSLFCRALLQKRPIILRSLLIVATPTNRNQLIPGYRETVPSTVFVVCTPPLLTTCVYVILCVCIMYSVWMRVRILTFVLLCAYSSPPLFTTGVDLNC